MVYYIMVYKMNNLLLLAIIIGNILSISRTTFAFHPSRCFNSKNSPQIKSIRSKNEIKDHENQGQRAIGTAVADDKISLSPAMKLQRASQPDEILDIVDNFGNSLKTSHCTMSLLRIAKGLIQISNEKRRISIQDDSRFQKLWSRVAEDKALTASQLSEAIWACGLLGYDLGLANAGFTSAVKKIAGTLRPHEVTSVSWAYERLGIPVPGVLQNLTDALPFKVLHRCFQGLNVKDFLEEVHFRKDQIVLGGKTVTERRQTCWQADLPDITFGYSGKSMPADPFTPRVAALRDRIEKLTGVYYDGVLINHYPDGNCGMRYHSDPDQGIHWDYTTAVVSVGDTRQFIFRECENHQNRHLFYVSSGDCMLMFGNCQEKYQHCVKVESNDKQSTNCIDHRLSFVFKKSI